jgi:hypothetical protein
MTASIRCRPGSASAAPNSSAVVARRAGTPIRVASATKSNALPYIAVREADDPDAVLLEFLQSTYDVAADTGRWDRAALESRR